MKKISFILFSLLFFSLPVFSAGPDFSALSSAIDFITIISAIFAAAAVVSVVYIAIRGAGLILYFIRGDYKIEGEEEGYY